MVYKPRRSRINTTNNSTPLSNAKKGGIKLPGFLSVIPKKLKGLLPKGKWTRQRIMIYAGIGIVSCIIIGYIGLLILFAWYARDLPSPGKLSESSGSSSIFYDAKGSVIYQLFEDKNRVPVKFDKISDHLKQGTIAIEDKNFYKHSGISRSGIIRAFFSTVFLGEVQGASTITQQLIKNVLLSSERTVSRKVKEAILTAEVEKRYTKDEILEMYLNEAPYGGSYWGVESAAKGYFDKQAKDLNLLESAILAGLPQSPTRYSPFLGEEEAWKGRTKDVLRRMKEDKYITEEEAEKALKQLDKYEFDTPKESINAPHFVFFVRDFLEEKYGKKVLEQGLEIKTTLNLDVQNAAQKIIKDEITNLKDEYNVGNGAAVVLDSQTSEVIALVGSYDFNATKYGKFDAATQALRQPGSTLKPIAYALAFENGYTPASVLMDVSTDFGQGYEPVNYDGTFRGPVQMRFALASSLNIPAVKTLGIVGLRDFLSLCSEMGLENLAPTEKTMSNLGLSAVLGGGDVRLINLAQAYTVFARGGTSQELAFIEEVKNFKGKVIYKRPPQNESRVLSEEVSFLISHILSDDGARSGAFGTGSLLNIPGKTVAVKTGTTDDKRDNWAVGYTKGVTVAVWVGNNDNEKMNPQIASGTTGATPIWHDIMKTALKEYDDGIIDLPANVKAVEIDAFLGGLPKEGQPTRSEYFVDGTEPTDTSPFYKKLKIHDGKLANEMQIEAESFEEKDFIVFTEEDPLSADGRNRWQEGIDAWIEGQEDEKYKPPTEVSDGSAEDLSVDFQTPGDKQRIDGNRIEVKAKITSVAKVKEVKIYINNEEKWGTGDDVEEIAQGFDLADGTYQIKLVVVNEKDKRWEAVKSIGVNRNWDESEPAPQPTTPPIEPTAPPMQPTTPPESPPVQGGDNQTDNGGTDPGTGGATDPGTDAGGTDPGTGATDPGTGDAQKTTP